MSAQDFPITTGYGQIPGYPLNDGFHRGEDRTMPVGTQVLVNGMEIGLSGNTGASTGAHLHIGKWVNGLVQPPQGQGFDLPGAVVYDTGFDATDGNFVRLIASGVIWVYLHLSKISVKAGQIIKGVMNMTEDGVRYGYLAVTRAQPTKDQIKYWVGRSSQEFTQALWKLSDDYYGSALAQLSAFQATAVALKPNTVYKTP